MLAFESHPFTTMSRYPELLATHTAGISFGVTHPEAQGGAGTAGPAKGIYQLSLITPPVYRCFT